MSRVSSSVVVVSVEKVRNKSPKNSKKYYSEVVGSAHLKAFAVKNAPSRTFPQSMR